MRIAVVVCVGALVLAFGRHTGRRIDFAVGRASIALLMMIALLGAWAIRSIIDRRRSVKSRRSRGEAEVATIQVAGRHMALGLMALGVSIALAASIAQPLVDRKIDLLAIAFGTLTAGIWMGLWSMTAKPRPVRARDLPVTTVIPRIGVALPAPSGVQRPIAPAAAPARAGAPNILRHLYDRDGGIFYSAEVEADLPAKRVAQTLWNASLCDKIFRESRRGRPDFENLHIRDATFENFGFDNRDIADCVFENVRFDGVWSAANWHLTRCRVERCSFVGSAMHRSNISDCTFVDVDMTEVYIAGSFDNCTLTNVRFSLDSRDRAVTVGLSRSILHNVTFAGADIPEIRDIYSKVYAEIVRRDEQAPVHTTAWLYNLLTAVFGNTWQQLAERHGVWTALSLLFYYNSSDTRFVPIEAGGQAVLDHIRLGALAEAGRGN